MTNEERRAALAKARTEALACAEQAVEAYKQNAMYYDQIMSLSLMWANVANALKREDGEHSPYVNFGNGPK